MEKDKSVSYTHLCLGDLSVADKQLVAICRALLHDARLLIMDEPTTALTKKEVASLFKIVRELQKKGISILFVSHKLEEVFEIADELTIIRNGKKVIDGAMKDFEMCIRDRCRTVCRIYLRAWKLPVY